MVEDAVWQCEEDFWVGPPQVTVAMPDPDCLMAFPAPAGLLAGADAIAPTLPGQGAALVAGDDG